MLNRGINPDVNRHNLRFTTFDWVKSHAHSYHSFQIRWKNCHIFKSSWQSYFILQWLIWPRRLLKYLSDDTVLVVRCTHENSCIGIKYSYCWCFLVTLLFETDEFDNFLSLRSLRKNLFILDLLGISFFSDVGIKVFEEEIFIIDRFDPDLVIVAFIVIEFGIELLLDKLLLGNLRFRLHLTKI